MTEPRLLGDRYELGEVLGRGGMAEVRRGRDLRLGRVVAIKMLRVDHASDATFQARFRREAQSAASLNHRHIVAVYDTGEDFLDGHRVPYIVMEYVEGRTLRELLQERARFTPERSIEVTAGILDALEYSHRAGIVHRDIKPGNVMVTSAGEVKVMDFGIARSLAETGAALTQTAAVVGTAQYISPEQARGESADARSDLYATGCVLYELLTGRPPFVGESLVSVAVSHVREMATPPSALDPSIPRDLDAIVLKALAKDRLDRYQSAYEMRADLERCAAGLPVAAAADATAATQLIGGAGYGDTMYDQAPTAMYDDAIDDYDDAEEPERKGMSWGALIAAALAILAVAGLIGYLMFGNDGDPEVVRMPEVVGDTFEEAQAQLVDLGLVVTREDRATENEDEVGTVLQQSPEPNVDVEVGSTVTLTVGVAPDDVAVPEGLVGMTQSEAEAAIRAAGLEVGDISTNTDTDADAGTVVDTNPRPGTMVAPGTAVNLVVAAEPDSVTVPDLVGMTRDEARDALVDAGLQLGDTRQEASSSVEEGRVINSEPRGGQSVEPGSRVNLIVSSGEADVTVPSVIGMDENQAQQMVQQAGLEFEVEYSQQCEETADRVFTQEPGANSSAAPGSTVRVGIATHDGCPPDNGNDNGNGNGDD
jgi:eukaryotic-like serine/threonine-protein kinase